MSETPRDVGLKARTGEELGLLLFVLSNVPTVFTVADKPRIAAWDRAVRDAVHCSECLQGGKRGLCRIHAARLKAARDGATDVRATWPGGHPAADEAGAAG